MLIFITKEFVSLERLMFITKEFVCLKRLMFITKDISNVTLANDDGKLNEELEIFLLKLAGGLNIATLVKSQPVIHSVSQSVSHSVTQSVTQSVSQSVNH